MSTFQYTITKFDNVAKTLDVDFGMGNGYAKITLMDPLPKDVNELELIIKQYVLPQQYIDALNSPVDMSYVTPLVGHTRQCERRSIQTSSPAQNLKDEESDCNANQNWNVDNPYGEDPGQAKVTAEMDDDVATAQNEFEQAVLAVLKQKGLIE